jgi:LmbE family N-acetylglucosaminyl deacetylase|tara:strand:- start:176 stop:850 length:675 start_codon:yes stop_codon:yes gene_type:complete
MKLDIKKAIIIAPHPDDETLGVGGTIKRMINESVKVSVLIVSGHMPPLYKITDYKKTLEESKKVFKYLGVKDYEFLNIPATKVNEISVAELNGKISKFVNKRNPDTIFAPFPDRHIDHRIIFDSSIVASRPVKNNSPKNVLLYETLSETHWNVPTAEPSFIPDLFINIDSEIKNKLLALKLYKSQINKKNPSRSIEAAKALAKFRGSQNGCNYAEAFKVARIVI